MHRAQTPARATSVRYIPSARGQSVSGFRGVGARELQVRRRGFTRWWRLLAPQALAGRPGGLLVGAACFLLLGLIFIAERLTPPTVVVGAFGLVPVLVAVWLLSGRLALAVATAAALLRIGAVFLAGIHPLTMAAEVVTIGAIATVGRFAAVAVSAYWAAEARLAERERIARELHDGTIQSLFAVGIGLRATRGRERDPELRLGIEQAVAELDGVIRDLRNYVFGLRPLILAQRQLDQALEELVRELESKTSVKALTDIDHLVAAGLAAAATDVIQLARESLSNVGRHSRARTCWLSLRRDGTAAVLEVRDDGRGFNAQDLDGAGRGLVNLRERAAALGGTVTIDTAPSRGTSVRIALPIRGTTPSANALRHEDR
jgi:signal transduction histidine kinase